MADSNSAPDSDKTGEALKVQRFRMLEDIAAELSGDVVFPTHFDAVLHLRKALQNPDQDIGKIAQAVAAEPLVSAKLLHLANSAAFNAGGGRVLDLKSAIIRLGMTHVRSVAMAVVMTQLMRAKGMAEFADLARELWAHSIRTSAAARLLAGESPRLKADEAMLAGLIHDLGAFYMLYRATQYDELRKRPDTIRYLIAQWHEGIGVSLLDALELPESIVDGVADHDHPHREAVLLRTLSDVVQVANLLAGGRSEGDLLDQTDIAAICADVEARYGHLRPEIDRLAAELGGGF